MAKYIRWITVLLALIMMFSCATVVFADEENVVDTTKLEELLQIANSAKKENYTAETWVPLEIAIAQANAALTSNDQVLVDAAKSALALALSEIKSMDYSAVESAIADAKQYASGSEYGTYWQNLQNAIDAAKALYGSGNQEGVNQAAELIQQRVAELRAFSENQQEEPTAAAPVLWIVLFAVSMAANAALAVLLWRKVGVQKNQKDDMPLVEYDIDDDVV